MQIVTFPVPAQNGKAKARAANLQVWPIVNAPTGEKDGDAGAAGHEFPGAIGLFADQTVALASHAVALCSTLRDDGFGEAIAIEVSNLAEASFGAGEPLFTLEFEASRFERCDYLARRELKISAKSRRH